MVGAASVRAERAAKVGGGEKRHIILDTEQLERVEKRAHRLADHRQHVGLVDQHLVVVIPAAERHEESLSPRPERVAPGDGARDHLELPPEVARRESRSDGERSRGGGGEKIVGVERRALRAGEGALKHVGVFERQLAVHRRAADLTRAVFLHPLLRVAGQADRAVRRDRVFKN